MAQLNATGDARFRQILRAGGWLSLLAIIIALIALQLFGIALTVPLVIATVVGVGGSVGVGVGLMALMYLSARGGHDEGAADHTPDEWKDL